MSTGLNYQYYEYYFNDNLNWFDGRSVSSQGTQTGVINYSNSNRYNDTFSLRWWGYIVPKVSGTWEFYTASDDSSRLYIAPRGIMFNSSHNPRNGLNDIKSNNDYYIVQNSGIHGNRGRYGSIDLQSNTAYEMILYFGDDLHGNHITFRWKPPNYGTSNSASTFLNSIGGSDSYLEFYKSHTFTLGSFSWGSYINSDEIDSSGSFNISIAENYPIDKFIFKDKYFPQTEKVIHNIEFSQFTSTSGSQTTFNNFFNSIYGDLFTFDSYLNYTNWTGSNGYASANPQTYTLTYPEYPNSMSFFYGGNTTGYITLTSKIRGYCKLYYGNGDNGSYIEVLKNGSSIDVANYATTDKQKLVEFYIDIDDVIKVQEVGTTAILYTLVVEELYAKVTIEDNATYISPPSGVTIEFSDITTVVTEGESSAFTNATTAFNNLFNNKYGIYFTFSSAFNNLNNPAVLGTVSTNPQSYATNYPDYPNSISWWYSSYSIGYVEMISKISGYCKLYYGNVHGSTNEYTAVTKNDIEIDRANVGDYQKLVEFSVNIGDIIKISEHGVAVTALYALVVEAVGNEFIPLEPYNYNNVYVNNSDIVNNSTTLTIPQEKMQDIYNNSVTTNNPEFIPWKYNWDFRVYNNVTIETNGTVFDIQNRHAGRIKNASVSFTQQDGAYFSGNISGSGNGSGPYIDIDDFSIASPCTFETYFKFEDAGRWARIIDFGDGANVDNFLIARSGTTQQLSIHNYQGSTNNRVNFDMSLTNNYVHLVTIIDSDTNYYIYINGELKHSSTGETITNVTRRNLWVGKSNWGTADASLKGYIKYLRFWDTSISGHQVGLLYANRDTIFQKILDYPIIPYDILFNKVRIIRTSKNLVTTNLGHITFNELQVWDKYGNNIALTGTATSKSENSNYIASNAINNNIGSGLGERYASLNTSFDSLDPEYWLLTLSNAISISDLASIVMYSVISSNNGSYSYGTSIQLLNNNEVLYSQEILTANQIYRIDGPAIYNVSSFASDNSTTNIISDTYSDLTKYGFNSSNQLINPYVITTTIHNDYNNVTTEFFPINISTIVPTINDISYSWGSILNSSNIENNGVIYVDASNTNSVELTLDISGEIYTNLTTSRTHEIVNFDNIKNGPLTTAQSWLDTNHPLLNIQLIFHNPYFGHNTGQYLSAPTTDDGCIIWTYHVPTSNIANNTGIISFTVPSRGQFTIVYGCVWTNESVKIYKNNVLIDETTSVKKSFTFDAEKDDVIEIRELYAVMIIYSIEFLEDFILSIPSSTLKSLPNISNDAIIRAEYNENIAIETITIQRNLIKDISLNWGYILDIEETQTDKIIHVTTNGDINSKSITATLDNNSYSSIIFNNEASINIPYYRLQQLTNGIYEIIVSINDNSNNTISKNISFEVDKDIIIVNDISLNWGNYINSINKDVSGVININTSYLNNDIQLIAKIVPDYSFKKIKISRLESYFNTDDFAIGELQMFVNGSNILNLDGSYTIMNNNDFTDYLVTTESIEVTLDNEYKFHELQSIVFYTPFTDDDTVNTYYRNQIRGCALQLLDISDNIIYTSPIFNDNQQYYYRFDGFDIKNGPMETTEDFSTTLIINKNISYKYKIHLSESYLSFSGDVSNNSTSIIIPETTLQSLADGLYNIFITNDNNKDANNYTSFTADLTIPIINDISFSWGDIVNKIESENNGYIYISTTGVQDNQIATASIYNTDISSIIFDNSATFLIPQSLLASMPDNVSNETYNAIISSSDIAGNIVTETKSFKVDTTFPLISNVSFSWNNILNILDSDISGSISITTYGIETNEKIYATINNKTYEGTSNNDFFNLTSIIIPLEDIQNLNNDTTYNVLIETQDIAENDTSYNLSFIVDRNPPLITDVSFSWGNLLNIPKSNISGTIFINTSLIENNKTITATIDGDSFDSKIFNNNASIIIPLSKLQSLTDNSYNINITSTNNSGNIASENFTLFVDKELPVINEISLSWGNYLNINESNNDQHIYIDTSNTSTNVINDNTISLTLNNYDYSGVVIDNSTSIIIPSVRLQELTDGSKNITVTVTNDIDNTITSNISFFVKRTPPVINTITISWGEILNFNESEIDGSLSIVTSNIENGQTINAILDASNYSSTIYDNSAVIIISKEKLRSLNQDTSYNILINSNDIAINNVSKLSDYFIVNKILPEIEIITFSWDEILNINKSQNDGSITINVKNVENNLNSITINLNNEFYYGNVSNNIAVFTIPKEKLQELNNQIYTVIVDVYNAAGNYSTSSKTFTVDFIPPIINNIIFSWGDYLNKSINSGFITIETSNVENGNNAILTLDNISYTNTVYNNSTIISIPQSRITNLLNIEYIVTVNITNNALNNTTSNKSFIVDKISPTIDTITFSWGDIMNTGESTTNGSINVFTTGVENNQIINGVITKNGSNDYNINISESIISNTATINITANTLSTLINGLYTVTFTVSDNAGNSTSTNQEFTVDKSIPSIILIGDQVLEHARGTIFVDPGVTAFDSKGINLTENVTSENNINENVVGNYSITYYVSDIFGNSISLTRIVRIVNRFRIDDVERKTIDMFRGYLYEFDLSDSSLTDHNLLFSTDLENQNLLHDASYQITRIGNPGNDGAKLTLIIPFTHIGPIYYFCEHHDDMGGVINVIENNDITIINENTTDGPYFITYDVVDEHGLHAERVIRNVNVVDTKPPEIILDGSINIIHEKGDVFSEPGYSATDFSNIDLTSSVVIDNNLNTEKIGDYTIVYTVYDEYGNFDRKTRYINVIDRNAPVITLIGGITSTINNNINLFTHLKDSPYNEPGYTAIDYNNVNLLYNVDVSGTVENEIGEYFIHYNVTDSAGNKAIEKIRIVNVIFGEIDSLTNSNIQQITNEWINDPENVLFKDPFNEPYYGTIDRWNVTQVTDLSGIFANATSFNDDISNWNVSNVTNMTSLFENASSFNADISNWNVSNVTNMTSMFKNAFSFNQDISGWIVSNVTNMSSMFQNATIFNANISEWNISNVTNMTSMFRNASNFNQNIRIWNVNDNVILTNIFDGASAMISEYIGFNGFGPPDNQTTADFFLRIDAPLDISNINIIEFYNDEQYINIQIILPIQDISENNPETDDLPVNASIGGIPLTNIVRTTNGLSGSLDLTNNTNNGLQLVFVSFKLSNNFTINFNGRIVNFYNINCLNFSSNVIASNQKYLFNNNVIYDEYIKYGLYDGSYTMVIPESDPIAILNSNITYYAIDDVPIVIKVSGGDSTPTNGDYFIFTDINNNPLQIANGSFKFMYGRTYRFADYGIDASHAFSINYYSLSGGSNGSTFFDITFTLYDLYYKCYNHQNDMSGNLHILEQNIDGVNYNFFYGSIELNVTNNFNIASVYSYYNGITSGENIFVYVTKCSVPQITLIGESSVIHEKGEIYDDSGVILTDATGEDLTSRLVITNDVSDNNVGSYSVIYNLTNRGNISAETKTRIVEVVDTRPPIITLIGDASINILRGHPYIEQGAIAIDASGDDLSTLIDISGTVNIDVSGIYSITYDVSDNQNNIAETVIRTVRVFDNVPPVISLNGSLNNTLQRGDLYSEPGFTAIDNEIFDDENYNITDRVIITTDISMNDEGVYFFNNVGTFIIQYSVTDDYQNTTVVTRTFEIIDTIKPTLILYDENLNEYTQDISLNHQRGDTLENFTYTAFDLSGENLTNDVIVTGDVCGNVLSIYTVNYSVSDIVGNNTSINRIVNVYDDAAPTIILRDEGGNDVSGDANMTVQRGFFQEPGFYAYDLLHEDITNNVSIVYKDSNQNTLISIGNVIGSFIISYDVSDNAGNFALTVRRNVTIYDDIKPTILLKDENNNEVNYDICMNQQIGEEFQDPGYIAYDLSGEFLTSNVVAIIKDSNGIIVNNIDTNYDAIYTITYDLSDNAGNIADTLTRTVIVKDFIPPVITILGSTEEILERGQPFVDQGATARDNVDGVITNITTTGTVDALTIGDYEIIYSAIDSYNNVGSATRIVRVRDTIKPVITLIGPSTIIHEKGFTFEDTYGASASDLSGVEDLTNDIITTTNVNVDIIGSYTISYNVSDIGNNQADTVTRTVIVQDTTAPLVSLVGDSIINLPLGSTYIDEGYSASDYPYNTDVTNDVIVTNNYIDNSKTTTYTIDYNITDSSNNTATYYRYINFDDYTYSFSSTTPSYTPDFGSSTMDSACVSDVGVAAISSYSGEPRGSGSGKIMYTHNNGANWYESTVNYSYYSVLIIRGLYITRNGQYSVFGDPQSSGLQVIYISTNRCQTYNQIPVHLTTNWFHNNIFLSEDGNTCFVTVPYNAGMDGVLFINTNVQSANSSWIKIDFGSLFSTVYVKGNSDISIVYVGSSNGIWYYDYERLDTNIVDKSVTASSNWKQLDSGTCYYIDVSSDGKTIVYGKSDGKIFISTNKGLTFNRVVDITNTTAISTISVSSDGNIMFATIDDSTTLFISFNNGRKWHTYTNLYNLDESVSSFMNVRNGSVNNNMLLLVDYANDKGNFFYLNKDLIVRTPITDSIIEEIFNDYQNNPMDDKFINPLNTPYYGLINEWFTQLTQYTDSVDNYNMWFKLSNLGTLSCYEIKMNYSGQYIYISTSTGVLRSDDYGENWSIIDSTYVKYRDDWRGIALSKSGQIVYIINDNTTSGNHDYVSYDYGMTWNVLSDITGKKYSICISHNGKYICSPIADTGSNGGIWCSTDYGNTWSKKNSLANFTDCAMSSSGQFTLLISIDGTPKIWLSNDYLNSFSSVKTLTNEDTYVNTGCAMSSSGKYMVTGSKNNIYVSSDYGKNWNSKRSLNNVSAAYYTMDETGQYMYASYKYTNNNDTFIYYSENYGESWSIHSNFPDNNNFRKIASNYNSSIVITSAVDEYIYMKKNKYFSKINFKTPKYSWDFRNKKGSSIIYDSINNKKAYFYERSNDSNISKTITTNNGVDLDGVNDFIITDLINYGSSFTIEVYFKPDTTINNWARVFSSAKPGEKWTNTDGYTLTRKNGSDDLALYMENNERASIADFFTGNVNKHLLFSYDYQTKQIELSLNNNQFKFTYDGIDSVDRHIILGWEDIWNLNDVMKGRYYSLRVWDQVLPEGEVEYIFNTKDIEIEPESINHFNSIRLLRSTESSEAGNTNDNSLTFGLLNRIECAELQLWIKDSVNNIVNISPTGLTNAVHERSAHPVSIINNEGTLNSSSANSFISSHDESSGGLPIIGITDAEIRFDTTYNISDIASIVYYNLYSTNTSRRAPGTSIQLLNNDTVIYTYEIGSEGDQTNCQVFKIHGPALPHDYTFADSLSTTSIIKTTDETSPYSTPYLLVDSLFEDTFQNTIRKIRVRRVADQEFSGLVDWFNLLHIAEIQFWINGDNVAPNGYISDYSNYYDYYDRYLPENVLNGSFGFENQCWHADQYYDSNMYDYITVTLDKSYKVNLIQSVVVYLPDRGDSYQTPRDHCIKGCIIELLDNNDNVLYATPTITSGARYNRLDGPQITSASFSSSASTTSIIDTTTNFQKWNIIDLKKFNSPSYNWDFRRNTESVKESNEINYIQDVYINEIFIKKEDNTGAVDWYWHFREIQLWTDNENIAVYGNATHSQGTTYYGGSIPANIIDGNINSGWHLPDQASGGASWLLVKLDRDIPISKIQSIVFYNEPNGGSNNPRLNNVRINLRYNTRTYWDYKFSGVIDSRSDYGGGPTVFRFDGPAIGTVPGSLFSDSDSATYIKNITNTKSIPSIPQEIKSIPGLIGYFDANTYSDNNTWYNLVANKNNATTSGTIKIGTNVSSNGSEAAFNYLYGDTTTNVAFNATNLHNNDSEPEFTFIHISRYVGPTYGRIWCGFGRNFLSGFWSNNAGVYYNYGWISSDGGTASDNDNTDVNNKHKWILTVNQNTYTGGTIRRFTNGFTKEYHDIGGSLIGMYNIGINQYYNSESSNWAVAIALMYDRTLTNAEILSVEKYLKDKYFKPEIKTLNYNDTNNTGWKKIFKQTAPYLWDSGDESSALLNMQNNQLNTESDDNYSIMNELYNSYTRNNFKYNSVYKFKMINSIGNELTWTQVTNPFDYTSVGNSGGNVTSPVGVSNISTNGFTLSSGSHNGFQGLFVNIPQYQNYALLDGTTSNWSRHIIGQTGNSSGWNVESDKLVTISSTNDDKGISDWVELYVYTEFDETAESKMLYNYPLNINFGEFTELHINDNIASTNFDNYFNGKFGDFITFSADFNHTNRTEYPIDDAQEGMSFFKHNEQTGGLDMTCKKNGSIQLTWGQANYTGEGIPNYTVKLYKNDFVNYIDITNDAEFSKRIRKKITLDVSNGDVIRLKDDEHTVVALYSIIYTYDIDDSVLMNKFNKIKLIRTLNIGETMNANEIELYIHNTNICRLTGVTTTSSGSWSTTYSDNKIIDGNTSDTFWMSDSNNVGEYCQINLVDYYDINHIEFLMIYNRRHDTVAVHERMEGVSLQLLNGTNIIYTYQIKAIQDYYRFDGKMLTNAIKESSPANLANHTTDIIDIEEAIVDVEITCADEDSAQSNGTFYIEFYDSNFDIIGTTETLFKKILNNTTITKSFTLNRKYDDIKVKIFTESTDGFYFDKLKITYNNNDYYFTEINNTHTNRIGVFNTVGWIDYNEDGISKPQTRFFTGIKKNNDYNNIFIETTCGGTSNSQTNATIYIEFYDSNFQSIETNKILANGFTVNTTKTKVFTINKKYNDINVKIFTQSTDGFYCSKLKITFLDEIYEFTEINNTRVNNTGVYNTVGWFDSNKDTGAVGPDTRFFTNIKGTVESESISTEVLNATLYNEPSMNHLDGILTGGYGSTDSSGQYVDLHGFKFGPNTSFEMYFKFVSVSPYQRIFDFGDDSEMNNLVLLRNNSSQDLALIMYDGSNSLISLNQGLINVSLLTNVYYHIVITINSNIINVYLDNVLVKTFTGDYTSFQNIERENLWLGRSNWSNDANQGQINYKFFRSYDFILDKKYIEYYYQNKNVKDDLEILYYGEYTNNINETDSSQTQTVLNNLFTKYASNRISVDYSTVDYLNYGVNRNFDISVPDWSSPADFIFNTYNKAILFSSSSSTSYLSFTFNGSYRCKIIYGHGRVRSSDGVTDNNYTPKILKNDYEIDSCSVLQQEKTFNVKNNDVIKLQGDGWTRYLLYSLESSTNYNFQFNKIRLRRTTYDTNGGVNIEVGEFQVWIGNGNIAPSLYFYATNMRSADTVNNPAEANRSYSSVWDTNHKKSMLDSDKAWSSGSNAVGQWMQINLGSVKKVKGVVTQGRYNHSQWVKSFKLKYSIDGSQYIDIDGYRTFQGNSDYNTKVTNNFDSIIYAQYIRFYPQTWNNHMSMRAGVLTVTHDLLLHEINDEDLNSTHISMTGTDEDPYISDPATKNLITHPIYIETSIPTTNLTDLQSIVIYGRNHSAYNRLRGVSLQLMMDEDVLYTQEINELADTSNQLVWRFDGGDIDNVSSFSNSNSTTNITSTSNAKLFKYEI